MDYDGAIFLSIKFIKKTLPDISPRTTFNRSNVGGNKSWADGERIRSVSSFPERCKK